MTTPCLLLRFPCNKGAFAPTTSAPPTPKPPTEAVFVVQEARMTDSAWGGTGRPRADEALARKGKFLSLIADGLDADKAAEEAGVSLKRALRIVTESDFRDIVEAIRAGVAGPTVVVPCACADDNCVCQAEAA